jgi:MoxR-like ATPase
MFKLNVPFLNRAELNEVVRRTTLGGGAEVRRREGR